ncbi:hypothetical protein B0675_24820 [Streptomyces sp. M41(2017)]|nr:hypothetical protein B0675_24820 [Streptomyces sp. M41(2017)]
MSRVVHTSPQGVEAALSSERRWHRGCGAAALDNRIEWGVRGGMTERERRALPEVVSPARWGRRPGRPACSVRTRGGTRRFVTGTTIDAKSRERALVPHASSKASSRRSYAGFSRRAASHGRESAVRGG